MAASPWMREVAGKNDDCRQANLWQHTRDLSSCSRLLGKPDQNDCFHIVPCLGLYYAQPPHLPSFPAIVAVGLAKYAMCSIVYRLSRRKHPLTNAAVEKMPEEN